MKKIVGVFSIVSLCFLSCAIVRAEDGVSNEMIKVGQSCALSGPTAALGIELKAGAEAYFDKVNKQGGINGRKIKLVSLDDVYEPTRCVDNTRNLISVEKVFALFGYVGTPTTQAIMPILDQETIPMIGPFTGAGFLRDPSKRIFNIRASYDQETGALVRSFSQDCGLKKIACLYQDDAYGKVGLSGVEKGLAAESLSLLSSATYERNTVAVKSAVAKLSMAKPDVVIMIGAYKPCAEFIKLGKSLGMNSKFANISFVGTAKLIEEMGPAGEGTFISQVVPSPLDTSIPLVKECADTLGRQPTYGELEGYLDAKVFVEGVLRAGSALTRDSFVKAMESMNMYDAGGVTISYGPGDHQGLDTVYFTKVQNGKAVAVNTLK